jgi:hypothetical protein
MQQNMSAHMIRNGFPTKALLAYVSGLLPSTVLWTPAMLSLKALPLAAVLAPPPVLPPQPSSISS